MPAKITKEQCIAELKRIAKKLGHTPTTDEYKKFNGAKWSWYRFGSYNNALKIAELPPAIPKIAKEQCVAELQRVAKKLGHPPVRGEWDRFAAFSIRPVLNYFSDYNTLLMDAGFASNSTEVSKPAYIAELQRVAKKLGHTPLISEFKEQALFSVNRATYRFGSWNKALEAAGLRISKESFISKARCLAELQRVAKKLGHTPTVEEFNEQAAFNQQPVRARFGSWNKALEVAGLKVNVKTGVSKAQCIAEFKRISKKLKRTPTRLEFDINATASQGIVTRLFGSWNNGLRAAGLNLLNDPTLVSKQQCISELQRVAKKLRRTPHQGEFAKYANCSSGPIVRRFGNWNNGLKAAGLKLNVDGDITKQRCITELKRVANELGRTPTSTEFCNHASLASHGTVANLFGSWNKGLAAAGLLVNKGRELPTKMACVKDLKRVARILGRTPVFKEFADHALIDAWTVIDVFGSWNKALEAAGLEVNFVYTTSAVLAANTEKAHHILKNMPNGIANLFPEVLIKALFDLLGKAAPSLVPDVEARRSSIRIARPRKVTLGAAGDALKQIEKTLALSKGQENKIVLSGVMNTIDRMHTNKDKTYRRAVLSSKCNFARTMAKQFRQEVKRAREIQRSIKGMRYEQALLTIKLERPEGWYYQK